MTLQTDLALAQRLADAAGAAIRPFFRAAFTHETKSDASPVTEADRAAEEAIRRILNAEVPRDGIIGEEFGAERPGASRQWVLDPIDGTTSFMAGKPTFGTLIALLVDGWPVLGVIDQPIARERWVGAIDAVDGGAWFNGTPIRTRACPVLHEAVLGTTSPHAFDDHAAGHFLALASQLVSRRILYGGDCYNYGLLASGHIDLVCEAGLKLHDFAALVPVVEGAGGMMCDLNGEPLSATSEGHVLALGDPARLEDVLEAIGQGE
ncbi:MAG: inositol monophosphatase family protein [Sphingopyxis sp.]|nr:inositol monophosphatase family protein [Sphingopyxis sp.]